MNTILRIGHAVHRRLAWAWLPLMGLVIIVGPSPSYGESRIADAIELGDEALIESVLKTADINDVNAQQVDGMTALHWAVLHDRVALTERLLKLGANPALANRYGVQAIEIACQRGHTDIVKLLVDAGIDINRKTSSSETILMLAARTGIPGPVELLIQHGADVNLTEASGQTALMWAAAEGHTEVVERLLAAGAELRTRLDSGFDAFFFAVREGQQAVVLRLLQAGIDVNQTINSQAKNGRLPKAGTSGLSMAVENGHLELALELVKAGANPNDQRSGFAPLHILTWVRRPDRGDNLSGLPPPTGSGSIDSLEFAKRLVGLGADVNCQLEKGKAAKGSVSFKGATPFFMAADTADLPYMKLLVEMGAKAMIPNDEGTTPIMVAAGLGTHAPAEEAGNEEESIAAVAYLLELGAELDTVDENGETAMHGAAYKNFPRMVSFLDERGANLTIWNRENRIQLTPLKIAEGFRPGNFRPSPSTVAAIHEVMKKHGVEPPPPTQRKIDWNNDNYSKKQ